MVNEDWKTEYKELKPDLKPFQVQLLDEGPKSQSQAWLLNSMWCEWNKLKKQYDKKNISSIMKSHAYKDPWFE